MAKNSPKSPFLVTKFSDVPSVWTCILKIHESRGVLATFMVRWYDLLYHSPKTSFKNINLVHFFAIELGTSSDNFIAKFHKIWPFLVKKAQNFNKNVTMTPKTMYIPVLYLAMCAKITKLELKQKKNQFFAQF